MLSKSATFIAVASLVLALIGCGQSQEPTKPTEPTAPVYNSIDEVYVASIESLQRIHGHLEQIVDRNTFVSQRKLIIAEHQVLRALGARLRELDNGSIPSSEVEYVAAHKEWVLKSNTEFRRVRELPEVDEEYDWMAANYIMSRAHIAPLSERGIIEDEPASSGEADTVDEDAQ